MRKLLALATAAVLPLTACGGGTAEEDGQVTLTFSDWHLSEPHWERTLKDAIGRFEEQHPNISVDMEVVSYADKETKYATEIRAGRGPDVYHLHAYSLRSFIERGLAMDLTPFIESEGGDFAQQWFAQPTEMMKANGKWYALPGDFMAMVLLYNKTMFEAAGLDPSAPPETWAQFREAAKALTRDTDGDGKTDVWGFGTIGAIDPGWELRFTPFLFSFGGRYLTEDGTCSALDMPQSREAFRFYTSLVTTDKVVPPGVVQQNPGTVREQLANKQVATVIGSGWTVPILDTLNPDLNVRETVAATPVPVAEGVAADAMTTAWLSSWSMNPNTEHPEEAWELLKFITAKKQAQQWFDDARVLSSRKDVSGPNGYQPLLEDPFGKVIAQELDNARFVPQIPEWPQVAEAVNKAAQVAFSGESPADEALAAAHQRINKILGCSSG